MNLNSTIDATWKDWTMRSIIMQWLSHARAKIFKANVLILVHTLPYLLRKLSIESAVQLTSHFFTRKDLNKTFLLVKINRFDILNYFIRDTILSLDSTSKDSCRDVAMCICRVIRVTLLSQYCFTSRLFIKILKTANCSAYLRVWFRIEYRVD